MIEARAEFCQIFRSFFGQWSFKKKCLRDLLTFNWFNQAYLFQDKDFSDLNDHDMKRKLSNFASLQDMIAKRIPINLVKGNICFMKIGKVSQ